MVWSAIKYYVDIQLPCFIVETYHMRIYSNKDPFVSFSPRTNISYEQLLSGKYR